MFCATLAVHTNIFFKNLYGAFFNPIELPPRELLEMLVNEQQLFTSGVSGLCRESDFSGKDLKLRLDTKLYCYLHQDNMIGLWETYAVNGITVTNKIGSWNESFGLSVPPPNMVNIWHRRTSLHGLTVNVASINRTRPCPLNLGFIL